ncbi:MAG TPA: mucoidy inhibitor MuiA family protein [Bacteroidia bacterium]|nr:mucoidy inhibitor MuiA family protein [Bacteroidia bacterium]
MKKLIVLLALLIYQNAFCSLDTLRLKSKITDVTVFFSGAQVSREISLKPLKGSYILVVDRLPQELKSQSIQVVGSAKCKIISVKHMLDQQADGKKNLEQLDIEAKVESLEIINQDLQSRIKVFEIEEKLLIDNSFLGQDDKGSSVAVIKEAADFYRVRVNEIRHSILVLSREAQKNIERIQDFYTRVNEITAEKSQMFSRIIVAVDCDMLVAEKLKLNYYTASAGWEPYYDFRVDDISQPFVLVYNANVYQTTGEDWENVKINLSSNNPSLSGEKPKLLNWYLGRANPYQKATSFVGPASLKGRVLSEMESVGIPFANVQVYRGNNSIAATVSDFDGNYSIKPIPPGVYTVKVLAVGFQQVEMRNVVLSTGNNTYQEFKLRSGVQLSAVEVLDYKIPLRSPGSSSQRTVSFEEIQAAPTRDVNSIASQTAGIYQRDDLGTYDQLNIRGSRSDGLSYYVDGIALRSPQSINYISNTLKRAVANLEYHIEVPYTIPSDGEDYGLRIKEVTIPVNYHYYVIPKLEKVAFLTAEILNWTDLDLLSGKASIYYQETFIGNSVIDAEQLTDTLIVSLGRDKEIIISREGNKELIEKRIIGNNIKETLAWDISIKNNKKSLIKITVEDQFPLSQGDLIEVNQMESSNAILDDLTGKLTWELELEPGVKKTVNYKYSVKYPKGIYLAIE